MFSDIETSPFVGSSKQLFLYHYRAVAHAFYKAEIVGAAFKKGMSEAAAILGDVSMRKLHETIQLMNADANELRLRKAKLDELLAQEQWSEVEGYAWVGKGVPCIFATDSFGPGKDFTGRIVQDCKTFARLKWVSLTITATEGNALVLLCAEKGSTFLRTLVDSLEKLDSADKTVRLMAYVICQLENFIMLPTWWNGLPEPVQRVHVNAYGSRYFPRELPKTCDWQLKRVA